MPFNNYDVCVIGGGASGLMAAAAAAESGLKTALIEKNTSMGRKLLVTGGGRCNVTNILEPQEFLRRCRPYDRFLRHSIYSFPPRALMEFLTQRGVETKVLESNCVFLSGERAYELLEALLEENRRSGTSMVYGRRVEAVEKSDEHFSLICGKDTYTCRKLIIAAGGASWPQTGSTGDGYALAASLGHRIAEPRACLVPLEVKENWVSRLAGVSLPAVSISCRQTKKHPVTGGLVFTDTGIGGPAVLNFSREILPLLEQSPVEAFIDLMPDLNIEELGERFAASITANPKSNFYSLMREYVPRSLGNVIADLAGINPRTQAAVLPKAQRRRTVSLLKSLELTITGTRPLKIATVTRGGAANDQIDPKTMESKLCPGLYLCGEVIDIDGPCGGFNLQIAFSTGRLAGMSAAL
ncbi:tricarballylate dehydrogenase [Limihaloglobus sulfuriphilus]|uniref:Tricarballylate dehydrogenase n=1 Tax=Limihaloglobus sulfuriphilus TaxID=1851148 RepID=A0A1Q2MHM0_9BACT|nr:aminoacetone oxidase family FAD-binding enzyme [Limihaloglobus sulfuriphilus]AQQ72154.1 tricarballylate dehydrogenase [Limihaloglobus sulfuriphilus]